MIKQVIAVRKDLKCRKGKFAAQIAHASMKVFFDRMQITNGEVFDSAGNYHKPAWKAIIKPLTREMKEWMEGDFTKIVVSVDTEKEIYELEKRAREADIPCAVIVDNGWTEFHGEKKVTCIAIGPDNSDKINKITENLSLF